MIKTILVPVSGTDSDQPVFDTALALARPMKAHLAFHHVRLTLGEAALHTPHMAFCVATGMPDALDFLDREIATLSAGARANVVDFCQRHGIALAPEAGSGVTASWSEESQQPEDTLLIHARHADLTVLGRRHHIDYMPSSLIEALLLKSGRPLVIASDAAPPAEIGTVLVGWQDKPEAARSLTAAMPLLKIAKQVILTQIVDKRPARTLLGSLGRHLERHGIHTLVREVFEPFAAAESVLAGLAAEVEADLLVIGGYSRNPLREALFGGVTRALIEGAEIPVFLLH